MKNFFLVFIFILGSILVRCQPQDDTLYLAFWNQENLFDTIDDRSIDDEAFIPNGEMEWTEDPLDKKMYNLSRIIRIMNDGRGPDLLGVCEVENQAVLQEMVNTYLSDLNYKIAYMATSATRTVTSLRSPSSD